MSFMESRVFSDLVETKGIIYKHCQKDDGESSERKEDDKLDSAA